MSTNRRTILAGLAGLGATLAAPAWAQAIRAQSDPWAQVDPYADARNGFPTQRSGGDSPGAAPRGTIFSSAPNDNDAMSEEEEIALGHDRYPHIIADSGGAHPDPRLQAALREFCRPMFAVSDRPHLPWQVTLCNDREPNAGAFAGGKVVINVGMFSICDRGGELAATVAHEIGHVDKRHTAAMAPVRELIFKLRQSGGLPGPNVSLETLVPNSQGQIKDLLDLFEKSYTRENEAEADGHEMVILERLGVAPIHAINDQHNFAKLGGSKLNELARTHPWNENRMAHIQQLAAMQRPPKTDYVFKGWDVLKRAFPTDPRFKKA